MSFIRPDTYTENKEFNFIESEKIDNCLLKNSKNDVIKAIDCLNSEDNFLYIHGFLGTGKRQFVNYLCEYLSNDVITLEYFCKEATVCDDILLSFIGEIEKHSASRSTNLNAKITTLNVKFQQLLEQIKKPTLIILNSFDNIQETNKQLVLDIISKFVKTPNVKIITTTCALIPDLTGISDNSKTIFLKAFTKDIFKEFILKNEIKINDKQIEDLYSLTRGYYLYALLSIKIIQTLGITATEFLQKAKNAGSDFDGYLGELYVSLIPTSIRNFFWFLKAVRHGLSLNALAIFEIYDEFSIQYLISNMILFKENEIIYLHDYFAQRVSTILPKNTEIRLHKYIIGIYEKQLKETLENRAIFMSRQALRAEIDYHSQKINAIENGIPDENNTEQQDSKPVQKQDVNSQTSQTDTNSNDVLIAQAHKLMEEDKNTEAIEKFKAISEREDIDLTSLVDVRLNLARLYFKICNYTNSLHYYELVETYYKNNKEYINLNYLYYEMTDLYYKTYKTERAIETIKQVVYSVDTPQSLMVSACTLLGNIYSDTNNPEEAFTYYQKALDSLDENVDNSILSELYFKFALANDDRNNISLAFEYYNRCISMTENNKYLTLAYSNIASCYYENGNYDDALGCYLKAYEIEKFNNNYDGIYYTSSQLATIYTEIDNPKALKYLEEAKRSAEFINDNFCIAKASVALGDYYYNQPENAELALKEYYNAKQTVENAQENIDISTINKRIEDMKLRLPEDKAAEILSKYE